MRRENWSEPLDAQLQLGILAESYEKSITLLKADFHFLSGMAPSGLSHLDLILVCLIVWCGPRASRTSTGHSQVVSYCFLTEIKVATTRERNGKRQRNFTLLKSLCSYNHGLLASTDLCSSIHVFLICARTRDGEGKNVMP